ncbi:MAG: HD domain-containing protein [Chloroflexota bacterium]|nr:HD domain-containing protein [Chloroflexota bacterium]
MQMSIAAAATPPERGKVRRMLWRVRQFGHAIDSRPSPADDAELQQLLASDAQWRLLAHLTPFDRAHHLRVHTLLVEAGHDDPDLLLAGLLHDVGKADERGRVSVPHRAVHVLLVRLAPSLLDRLSRNDGWFRHGLWLSVRHAEVGACLVAAAGGSQRCCALIACHNKPSSSSDPLLAALVAADNAAIR